MKLVRKKCSGGRLSTRLGQEFVRAWRLRMPWANDVTQRRRLILSTACAGFCLRFRRHWSKSIRAWRSRRRCEARWTKAVRCRVLFLSRPWRKLACARTRRLASAFRLAVKRGGGESQVALGVSPRIHQSHAVAPQNASSTTDCPNADYWQDCPCEQVHLDSGVQHRDQAADVHSHCQSRRDSAVCSLMAW